jgi:protein tyrosine phosphatase (PTP) superfamily phosphohydrolase (DUF442 family)
MLSRRYSLGLLALTGLVALAGCCTTPRQGAFIAARPYGCNHCGNGPVPSRFAPVPAPNGRLPAGPAPAFTSPPPNGAATPAPPVTPPTADTPPPPPFASVPPAGDNGPGVRLGAPAPLRRDAARPPTDTKEPPVASVPGKPPPAADEERDAPLPIELPGFAVARPNVASGLQPFPDGITWLKNRGYKVVLHLRAPGEDNTAARRLFEKKGLRYLSLEASPARMSKELLDEFNRIVTDTANHPLFVYDKDGSAAGGLWYLHFRVQLNASALKAKEEAQRLGLRIDDEDAEHRTMWIAVQKLAADLKP